MTCRSHDVPAKKLVYAPGQGWVQYNQRCRGCATAVWRRDCSAAFHLAPYEGKYEPPDQAPDALHIQRLLAGMADRGADVAVVECAAEGLDQGRCKYTLTSETLQAAAATYCALPCSP